MTPPSPTPIDQPTRDLVSRDGLGRTLFVEAGAGTGKTTQLVARIVNLVLEHGVRLVNVAAITFTEAAAAELQSRIRVEFERRAAEATGDERQRCLDALADADLAAISTLHGFASRLLGDHSVDAGLPPRVRVLDEVSSQLAREQRWAAFVDHLYDDPDHEALLERALLVQVDLEPRYPGHATLKDVAVALNDNWDRLATIAAEPRPPIGPVDLHEFDVAVDALHDVLAENRDPTDKLFRHLVDVVLPDFDETVATDDADLKLQRLAALALHPAKVGLGGKKAAWNLDPSAVKDQIRAVNAVAAEVVGAEIDVVLRNLLVLVAGEVLDAAHERRDEGGLEFHDLLVLAREMLRTSSATRDHLHERYTHILLDEFQDTDPIQIELAMRIAASITGGADAPWQELDVDDGRLFFVGDPKQSIYRFRRADIELFLQARDRFGPDGTWARLTTNFRTVAPVLDWVNAYFSAVMADEQEGKQPRYEPLAPWRDPSGLADHRPTLLGGPHPDPKVNAGDLRGEEARSVAAFVADVREHPDAWPVFDERLDGWRPASLRDVTILVPTRTSVPYLRHALEDRGVPYRLATGTLVYDTQEVRDALAALRAVDDPTDTLALVTALRSPLYACSDVDLFTFRRGGGRWDLRRDPLAPSAVSADAPPTAAPGVEVEEPAAPVQLGFDLGDLTPGAGSGPGAAAAATRPALVAVPPVADDDVDAESSTVSTDPLVRPAEPPVAVVGPAADVEPLAADHPVVQALAHLRSLWEQRWWLSPSAMLDRLLRERRAFLLGFGDPRPTEVWRRLRFLLDQARAFESAGGGDLRAFLEWAALQGDDGAKVHEPMLPETDDDAISILTIHGAKGLEFPITVLSGMTTRTASPRRGVSLVWDGDEPEVAMRKGVSTANHQLRHDLELEMDAHEKVRLLYVATTRARDHLVVSCHHKATSTPDTYASQLWSFFADHPDRWQSPPASARPDAASVVPPAAPAAPSEAEPPPLRVVRDREDPIGAGSAADAELAAGHESPDEDRDAWIAARAALLAPHRRPAVVSATTVARAARRTPTSDPDTAAPDDDRADDGADVADDLEDTVADDERDAGPAPVPARRQGRAGSAIGRAVHATLQVIDLADPAGPADLDAVVARQCELEAIGDLADAAAVRVRSALASDAVRLAAGLPHHRELYVAAPIGDRVVEGYVDLLVEAPHGLVVVDYKTDSAQTEAEIDAALATYELQGATYALALEQVTGLPVVEVRFVFCRPSGAIERAVADLPAALDRVRAALASDAI